VDRLRQWIERHRVWVRVVAAAVVVAAIVWALWPKTLPRRVVFAQDYFIDEETGKEYVRNMSEIPPLLGDSGRPTVVRAHFFSCDGGKTRKIAYLESYTEEGKVAYKALLAIRDRPPPEDLLAKVLHETLVRRPGKGEPWVRGDLPAALEIANSFHCPEGAHPIPMLPPKGEGVEIK
jgi:hypothetical protein